MTSLSRMLSLSALALCLGLGMTMAPSAHADHLGDVAYDFEYNPNPVDGFHASLVHDAATATPDTYGMRGAWLYGVDGVLTGERTENQLTLSGTYTATSLTGGADLVADVNGVFDVAEDGGLTGTLDWTVDGETQTFYFDEMERNTMLEDGSFTLWGNNYALSDAEEFEEGFTPLGIDLRGQPVPEPTTMALGAMGTIAAAGAIRRRRRENDDESSEV